MEGPPSELKCHRGASYPVRGWWPSPSGIRSPGIGKPLYEYDPLKWLNIGWENDHPKSWTFMGGGLAPGQQSAIQYALTVGGKVLPR